MSVWQQDRLGGGAGVRHALGLWSPAHKLASGAYLPGSRERRQLAGASAFWYALNFNLGPPKTAQSRFSVLSEFLVAALLSSASAGGSSASPGYRLHVLTTPENGRPQKSSILAVNDVNYAGSAKNPFFFRKLVALPARTSVLVQVQNLQAAPNSIQLVFQGYLRG